MLDLEACLALLLDTTERLLPLLDPTHAEVAVPHTDHFCERVAVEAGRSRVGMDDLPRLHIDYHDQRRAALEQSAVALVALMELARPEAVTGVRPVTLDSEPAQAPGAQGNKQQPLSCFPT